MIILPFGERVRTIRNDDLGKTLTEIAREVGISISYLSDIELGKRPFPGEDTLLRLNKAMGGDLSEATCAIDTSDLLYSMRYDPIKARIIWNLVYRPPSEEIVREIAEVLDK
jgi:transcriptional regulator with XRE-family HTH domain